MIANLPIIKLIQQHPRCEELVLEHHLEGLFFYQLKLKDKKLENRWLLQWRHNEMLRKELEQLSLRLPEVKICSLKGMSLLDDIYPDEGSRFMSDLDILVAKKDLEELNLALKALEFREISSIKWRANSFKKEWNKVINGTDITIETHTKLYFHVSNNFDSFKMRNDEGVLKLSLEDQLIHLCTHLGFQHTFLKLYWLFDIYFFVRKYQEDMDWETIVEKVNGLKVKNSFYLCLFLLQKFFCFESHVVLPQKKIWHLIFNEELLLSQSRRSIRFIIAKHLVKDSIWTGLCYDLQLLFSKIVRRKN